MAKTLVNKTVGPEKKFKITGGSLGVTECMVYIYIYFIIHYVLYPSIYFKEQKQTKMSRVVVITKNKMN